MSIGSTFSSFAEQVGNVATILHDHVGEQSLFLMNFGALVGCPGTHTVTYGCLQGDL